MQSLSLLAQDTMSVQGSVQEIKCVVHWFQGWTPMQKRDFMEGLVEKAVPNKVSTLLDAMSSLDTTMAHKVPNIFQCQLKLFEQWFSEWADKERNQLMLELEIVDSDFVAKFNDEIAATSGQP